jgi:hypothetical protein
VATLDRLVASVAIRACPLLMAISSLSSRLLGSLLALTALGGTACTDQKSSLYIIGVVKPPADCLYKAESRATLLFRGRVDRGLVDEKPYSAVLLVANQLVARGDPGRLAVETSQVNFEGAIVSVSTSTGAPLSEFTTVATGFAPQASGREPGLGLVEATLVPGSVGSPGQVVVARAKVFGTTVGGLEVESAEFLFPVDVCVGCLVLFPPGTRDPDPMVLQCRSGPDVKLERVCNPGVDQEVDCRGCANKPVCWWPPP